jgi:hypothetical protein
MLLNADAKSGVSGLDAAAKLRNTAAHRKQRRAFLLAPFPQHAHAVSSRGALKPRNGSGYAEDESLFTLQ